jgi:hypothetical protein
VTHDPGLERAGEDPATIAFAAAVVAPFFKMSPVAMFCRLADLWLGGLRRAAGACPYCAEPGPPTSSTPHWHPTGEGCWAKITTAQ